MTEPEFRAKMVQEYKDYVARVQRWHDEPLLTPFGRLVVGALFVLSFAPVAFGIWFMTR